MREILESMATTGGGGVASPLDVVLFSPNTLAKIQASEAHDIIIELLPTIEKLNNFYENAQTYTMDVSIPCDGATWKSSEEIANGDDAEYQKYLDYFNRFCNESPDGNIVENPVRWVMKVENREIIGLRPFTYTAYPATDKLHLKCAEEHIHDAMDDYHEYKHQRCGIEMIVVEKPSVMWMASTLDAEYDLERHDPYYIEHFGQYYCEKCDPSVCLLKDYRTTCSVVKEPITPGESDTRYQEEPWYPCDVRRRPFPGQFVVKLSYISTKPSCELLKEAAAVYAEAHPEAASSM